MRRLLLLLALSACDGLESTYIDARYCSDTIACSNPQYPVCVLGNCLAAPDAAIADGGAPDLLQ
jgi:hypothetical protein